MLFNSVTVCGAQPFRQDNWVNVPGSLTSLSLHCSMSNLLLEGGMLWCLVSVALCMMCNRVLWCCLHTL